MARAFLVLAWLAAITSANLITAHYGPNASVLVAFVFVGFTLVIRDRLHDLWTERRAAKMAALIATGAALAYIASPAAGVIGLASGAAFAAAELVDSIAYHAVRRWDWFRRSNFSNLFGAAVDSIVFPTIAFGSVMWSITAGQFGAKVAGALIVTFLLTSRR
jgi:uncharacterized PurR-regulated membrane protein YhhQ (DUF165 family)